MKRLEGQIQNLCEEFARSVQCHGMWDTYTVHDIYRAVSGEFREFSHAYQVDDIDGEHGMEAELLQLATVALKGRILLECMKGKP